MKEVIRNTAIKLAMAEEKELRVINEDLGIFFMPELAYSYKLGKELTRLATFSNWKWQREIKIIDYGIADILFTQNDRNVIIEIKFRGNIQSYLKDINRLKTLPGNYLKFFLLIVDTFDTLTDDVRIQEIQKQNGVKLVSETSSFQTNYSWYKKNTFCLISLWEIF